MDGQPPDERLGGPLGLDVVGQLVRPGGEDGVQRGGDVEGEDVAADVPFLGRFFDDLDLVRALLVHEVQNRPVGGAQVHPSVLYGEWIGVLDS